MDLRTVGVKGWKTRFLARTEWESVVREAKTKLKEQLCQRRRKVIIRRHLYSTERK
jgi:hypothetical protein